MIKANKAVLALAALSLLGGCGIFRGSGNTPKSAVLGERVAILTSESGVEVEPSLADVAVLLPNAAPNEAWTQPGGSATKSMGHLALGTLLTTAWTAKIEGASKEARLAAAPVIADGKLYAMDTGARIHAFDAGSGRALWSVQFGDGGKNGAALFGGGVSVDGAFLYATNGLGDVGALNVADGKTVWVKRPGGPLRGAPTVALGNVYVMSQDNQLIALAAADGAVQWTESSAVQLAGVFGVAAPAVGQGTVVAGFSSGDLNAYRYENGRTVWQDALSRTSINTSVGTLSDIDAGPVIDQGRVFAIGQGGRMVSLELVTGQRLWEINIAGISTPWVAGEWLFVVTDEAKLLCIARPTGKIRWVTQLKRYRKAKSKNGPVSWTGPVLGGGGLIVASSEGDLVRVNPQDGSVRGTTEVGAPMFLPPVIANSMLYVLDNSGKITAYR
ncbi:MAG: PQQ-binding-like beta-propeller repeat protein [Sphingomonadaceae bacterium]